MSNILMTGSSLEEGGISPAGPGEHYAVDDVGNAGLMVNASFKIDAKLISTKVAASTNTETNELFYKWTGMKAKASKVERGSWYNTVTEDYEKTKAKWWTYQMVAYSSFSSS